MPGHRRPPATAADLNGRQRQFVDEYMVDLNAAAAAQRAGYSERSSHNATKFINPVMRRLIDEALAERAHRRAAEGHKVVEELSRLAFANMADYIAIGDDGLPRFDFSRIARDEGAAIVSLTVDYFTPPPIRKRDRDRAAKNGQAPPPPLDHPLIPRRIRLQLADKRAALVDLARHLGIAAAAPPQEAADEPRTEYMRLFTGVPGAGWPAARGLLWVRPPGQRWRCASLEEEAVEYAREVAAGERPPERQCDLDYAAMAKDQTAHYDMSRIHLVTDQRLAPAEEPAI